jgi:hypothetical protein
MVTISLQAEMDLGFHFYFSGVFGAWSRNSVTRRILPRDFEQCRSNRPVTAINSR